MFMFKLLKGNPIIADLGKLKLILVVQLRSQCFFTKRYKTSQDGKCIMGPYHKERISNPYLWSLCSFVTKPLKPFKKFFKFRFIAAALQLIFFQNMRDNIDKSKSILFCKRYIAKV